MLTKGRDAVRFFLLSKKPETEFTFDIDLAQKQSEENPVFYVQYAHARAVSVIRQAGVTKINLLKFFKNFYEGTIAKKNSYVFTKRERIIILRLLEYPAVISHALNNLEPHQIVFYVQSLASDFHKFYNESKILVDDEFIKNNRLLIVLSVAHMIKKNLELLGVSAPEIM
jgi:arginyl-tRNA synthetase